MIKLLKFYYNRPLILFANIYYRLRSLFIIEKYDLIIIDDIFPNIISAWRFEEYLKYLNHFDNICIFCTGSALGALHQGKSINEELKLFHKTHPLLKKKVKKFQYHRKIRAKHCYLLFLNNAMNYLNFLKKYNIKFSFTLYPGAGLLLNLKKTDQSLIALNSSQLLDNLIVTQKNTYNYLIQNNLIQKEKINFIYGVVTPSSMLELDNDDKIFFQDGIMNIAFVANKQMAKGIDKGYDIFISAAKVIIKHNPNVFFHIIGPWSVNDIDVSDIASHCKFYGMQSNIQLINIYKKIDLIISPNKPFILKPGAFDGFPTAACSEAALCKVAMMVTDPLDLNIHFTNNIDIILIEPNVQEIAKKSLFLFNNPDVLVSIASMSEIKCKEIYSTKNQINSRIKILEHNILKA